MGSSDSKPEADNAADVVNDSFLQILNEVTKGKAESYMNEIEKLTKKRKHLKAAQNDGNDPNKSALLRLKNEKLKVKITKTEQQHKSELEFSTNLRKIYSELKEKLRNVENEKIILAANLNLELTNQKVKTNDLEQKLVDEKQTHTVIRDTELNNSKQLNLNYEARIADLEVKIRTHEILRGSNHQLATEVATYKREINSLKLQVEEVRQQERNSHNLKYNELLKNYNQTKLLAVASAAKVKSLETIAQSRYIKLGEHEATIQNLRASYNAVSADLGREKQSKSDLMYLSQEVAETHNKKYQELETKYNREQQINNNNEKVIDEIKALLVANVKLICMQQRGTFLEIKKTIEGMLTDLQFVIPNLNDRTIPTAIECNKEMEKLDMQRYKYMDILQQITAYQGRFEKFVRTKKSLCTLEKPPNFLSTVEIPYSFLHVIFLPLFRRTFTVVEQDDASIAQRPVNWNNNSRGALRKTRSYTPRANNEGRDDNAESSRNPNANYRGRAGFNKNAQRPPRSRSGPNNNNNTRFKPTASCVNDDSDNDSVVMLTVLTTGAGANSGATPKTVGAAKRSGTTCTLCCELFNTLPVRHLSCSHEFHVSCIEEWFESNTECPQCIRDEDDD